MCHFPSSGSNDALGVGAVHNGRLGTWQKAAPCMAINRPPPGNPCRTWRPLLGTTHQQILTSRFGLGISLICRSRQRFEERACSESDAFQPPPSARAGRARAKGVQCASIVTCRGNPGLRRDLPRSFELGAAVRSGLPLAGALAGTLGLSIVGALAVYPLAFE